MITSKMNVIHLKFSEIECTFPSVQNAYHKNLHKNIADWYTSDKKEKKE